MSKDFTSMGGMQDDESKIVLGVKNAHWLIKTFILKLLPLLKLESLQCGKGTTIEKNTLILQNLKACWSRLTD